MASRAQQKDRARQARLQAEKTAARAVRGRRLRDRLAAGTGVAVVVLAGAFAFGSQGGGGASGATRGTQAGEFPFAVGSPGPGAPAPEMKLASTAGDAFSLTARRGKRVLVYFQEGLGCQPCWDQIKDIEKQWAGFRALGIDEMVSVTTNDLDNLGQKAADEGITTPVLADPTLSVSRAYEANRYGMMGDSADGHSFIVVGPDGAIEHRADYGGPPNFTMYVPVRSLIADVRRGMRATGSSS